MAQQPWLSKSVRCGLPHGKRIVLELVNSSQRSMQGALSSSMHVNIEKRTAHEFARKRIRRLRSNESSNVHGGITLELIGDLAWLATGMRGERICERTIRRFRDGKQDSSKSLPDHAYWNKNWRCSLRRLDCLPHGMPNRLKQRPSITC